MAGLIPQSFINDLLARTDILDVIDGRLELRKAGRNHLALCPFHNEKSPSFSVNQEKQFYYCFGCGATGTALTFLMEYEHLDFVAAVELLARQAGVEVPREQGSQPKGPDRTPLYELLQQCARYYQQMLRQHAQAPRAVDYLKGRGIQGVTVRDFGIGFAPPGWEGLQVALPDARAAQLEQVGMLIANDRGGHYDRFRDRIMFPIRDSRGRVVGFGGRVLGDEQPKYLNSPETPVFHKGQELYGLYEARRAVRQLSSLLLVEGYMDVVALAQAGFPNAVATLGTASGEAHFDKLFRTVPLVICCFDGDNAGREAAWKALQVALPALREGRQLKFMFLPDGEDPDSLVRKAGRAGFQAQLDGALSASEFLFQRLSKGLDLRNLDARAQLASLALPLLAQVPEGLFRTLLLQRLGELTELTPERLQQALAQTGKPRNQPQPTGQAQPQPARRQTLAATSPQAAAQRALEANLLALAIQHPAYVRELDSHRQAQLLGMGDSLLIQVLRFLVEQPEADTASLLAYWMGTPAYGQLRQAAEREFLLSGPPLRAEFQDAVDRYLQQLSKATRQQLIQALQDNPADDKALLARWQALISGAS